MLLIWGWRVRLKTLGSGVFYCPHDGGDRHYQRKRAQRWFTFFFIPLIPLKILGEFIECASCGSTYDESVLTQPTAAAMMDNLANAMRYAVVALINADGVVDNEERRAALEVMERYSDTPYTGSDLERDLTELDVANLDAAMADVAGTINEHGKELLLNACLYISAADGHVAQSELDEVARAGRALGMSSAHVRGVLAGAVSATDLPERD